jgi:hypothetical protein
MLQKASRLRNKLENTVQKVRQHLLVNTAAAPVSSIEISSLNATLLAVNASWYDEDECEVLPSQPSGNDSWLVAATTTAGRRDNAISGKSLEAVALALGSLS